MTSEFKKRDNLDHNKVKSSYIFKAANIIPRKMAASTKSLMPTMLRLNSVGENTTVKHESIKESYMPNTFASFLQKGSISDCIKNSFNSTKNLAAYPEKIFKKHNTSFDPSLSIYPFQSSFTTSMDKSILGSLSSCDISHTKNNSMLHSKMKREPNKCVGSTLSLYHSSVNGTECESSVKSPSQSHFEATCDIANAVKEIAYKLSLSSNSNDNSFTSASSNSSDSLLCNSSKSSVDSMMSSEDTSLAEISLISQPSDDSLVFCEPSNSESNLLLSNSAAKPMEQQSVLLNPRKVKKGRPSSRKRRKRQRQKDKHLVHSSPIKTTDGLNSSFELSSKDAWSEIKEQRCNVFTQQSESDESEKEDDSGDWSLSDVPLSPIRDCSFSIALSMDDIFKHKNIPSLESLFFDEIDSPDKEIPLPISDKHTVKCVLTESEKAMKEINAKWDCYYTSAGFRSCVSMSKDVIENPEIKVRFAAEPDLLTVHLVGTEDRYGTWHLCALDRDRFQRRIQDVGTIISPVLEKQHREKIINRNEKLVNYVYN